MSDGGGCVVNVLMICVKDFCEKEWHEFEKDMPVCPHLLFTTLTQQQTDRERGRPSFPLILSSFPLFPSQHCSQGNRWLIGST
jgi:hypothetical protein